MNTIVPALLAVFAGSVVYLSIREHGTFLGALEGSVVCGIIGAVIYFLMSLGSVSIDDDAIVVHGLFRSSRIKLAEVLSVNEWRVRTSTIVTVRHATGSRREGVFRFLASGIILPKDAPHPDVEFLKASVDIGRKRAGDESRE